MKPQTMLDHMRVWAALTGLLMAVGYIAGLYLGKAPWPMLPSLVALIGGFEMFLTAQDMWDRRRYRLED